MHFKKILISLFKDKTSNISIQLFRYTFVGGIAFLIDFSTLIFLTEIANFHYLISAAIAFTLGLTTNYTLSIFWVFEKRTLSNKKLEFTIFAIIGCISLFLNQIFIWFFTEELQLHYTYSKIFATVIIYFWNFLSRKLTLFR